MKISSTSSHIFGRIKAASTEEFYIFEELEDYQVDPLGTKTLMPLPIDA
jgi:hypothetical protein